MCGQYKKRLPPQAPAPTTAAWIRISCDLVAVEPEDLGSRLRRCRQARGLTLAQLAQRTGISSSFLSLVEQGKSDITITRLMRLARFYGLTLSNLVAEDQAAGPNPLVIRREGAAAIHSPAEGIDMLFLLGGQRHPLSAVVSNFQPGRTLSVDTGDYRERLTYVLAGKFRLATSGCPLIVLRRGDAVVYQVNRAHSWTNEGAGLGQLLHVTAQLEGAGPIPFQPERQNALK